MIHASSVGLHPVPNRLQAQPAGTKEQEGQQVGPSDDVQMLESRERWQDGSGMTISQANRFKVSLDAYQDSILFSSSF